MRLCFGCDKQFRPEDLAPYMRNPDITKVEACRKCISEWIKLGILWADLPFWKRKQGVDA